MPINWGAIALGAIAGPAAATAVGLPLLMTGVIDTTAFAGRAALVLLGFAAQFAAGWTAARFAGRAHPLHGALASLAAFAAVSSLSLAAGSDPGAGGLAFGAAVAAVLGSAGGVLVQARERPPGR